MDSNLFFSIILIIFLLIVVIEWDEGMLLLSLGFIAIAIAINMEPLFTFNPSSYQGFGQLIQLIYAFIGLFSFVKIYFTAKDNKLDFIFGKEKRLKKNG